MILFFGADQNLVSTLFIKTYQTDRSYYRAVIKFLSSRSKWRFTCNILRKYYTCFVTFSFPIWSSLTSSLFSHNRCYGQLNDSSNSVPLHPFMTYWDSDLSKQWEIDNKKLRHIYNGKIEPSAVWSKLICVISKSNERTPRVLNWNHKYDLPYNN